MTRTLRERIAVERARHRRAEVVTWVAHVIGAVLIIAALWIARGANDTAREANAGAKAVACANSRFGAAVGERFRASLEQTRERIGTPAELPTDRRAVESNKPVLDALNNLAADVTPICGPVIP